LAGLLAWLAACNPAAGTLLIVRAWVLASPAHLKRVRWSAVTVVSFATVRARLRRSGSTLARLVKTSTTRREQPLSDLEAC
jgi:hypothetical protein